MTTWPVRRAATVISNRPPVPRWPLVLVAAGAFVSIWGGWVGLGELTGFGPIRLLPGIADQVVINSAITLPLGMEAYAAFALRAWLAPPSAGLSEVARRFARWSALGALSLGAAGQVAYHVMAAAGVRVAPWQITAFVACLPVIVLGCGAALVHLIYRDEPAAAEGEDLAEPDPIPADLTDTDPHGWWISAPRAEVAAQLRDDNPVDLDPADEGEPDDVDEHRDGLDGAQDNHDDGELPPWLDVSLPLGQRIELVIAAELRAGRREPKRRRVSKLLGLGEDDYQVRRYMDQRAEHHTSHRQDARP